MKTVIYYFTGTGNNLAIARDMAEALPEHTELIPIASLIKDEAVIADADRVGIVYPIWLHHLPPMVEEFARKLNPNGAYVFAVASYFKNPGNSLYNLQTILEENGHRLDSGFLIKMPGKYVLLYDLTAPDDENERRFIEEKRKVLEISEIVKGGQRVGIEGERGEDDKDFIINHHEKVYQVPAKFRVTESCNLCGLCVEICPIGGNALADGRIIWNEKCEYCLACLHWCPQRAIENGELSPTCRRYHHPDVTAADIIGQK